MTIVIDMKGCYNDYFTRNIRMLVTDNVKHISLGRTVEESTIVFCVNKDGRRYKRICVIIITRQMERRVYSVKIQINKK